MALSHRLDSLKKRHAQIEAQLHQEEVRPSPNTTLIQQLKREKLLLKDELFSLDLEDSEVAAA